MYTHRAVIVHGPVLIREEPRSKDQLLIPPQRRRNTQKFEDGHVWIVLHPEIPITAVAKPKYEKYGFIETTLVS